MKYLFFFSWYWNLFSDPDNKIRIGAWAATIATITFMITFIIKPSRNYILSKYRSNKAQKLRSFLELENKYSFEELKKITKIIVIDDEEIFPVSGFKQFGYNIDQWNKLNVQRLRQLREGEYDIIILGIWDVAKEIAENDGLDVLQDLKYYNPSQVVIAYSGHSFDFSKNKFLEQADEKLNKPTPFIGTQKIIDDLIENAFTVNYHLNKLKSILSDNNVISELSKVEDLFVRFKSDNAEPDWINEIHFLNFKNGEKQKISSIFKRLFAYSNLKKG